MTCRVLPFEWRRAILNNRENALSPFTRRVPILRVWKRVVLDTHSISLEVNLSCTHILIHPPRIRGMRPCQLSWSIYGRFRERPTCTFSYYLHLGKFLYWCLWGFPWGWARQEMGQAGRTGGRVHASRWWAIGRGLRNARVENLVAPGNLAALFCAGERSGHATDERIRGEDRGREEQGDIFIIRESVDFCSRKEFTPCVANSSHKSTPNLQKDRL
jgi:hypothetical protein